MTEEEKFVFKHKKDLMNYEVMKNASFLDLPQIKIINKH